MDINQIREENKILRQKITEYKAQNQVGLGLKGEIQKFVTQSKRNIKEMNERSIQEQEKANQQLHQMTQKYESVLKTQINLLTENKELSEQRDEKDKIFNEQVQKLTKQYESQIQQFEKKVKVNVKKIQEMTGGNIIKKLVKNQRFRNAMKERGCNLEGLEKQSELQEIAEQVQEKEKEIQASEKKSSALDEELEKMHQLIQTMKELMQNMQKEKENILKQNNILKEKLEQSEELIGKLLGNQGQQGEEGQEEGVQ